MKSLGVIPARYESTRFPGKPLANILGKPMLQWVIEGAKTSQRLEKVIVATDDKRIMDFVQSLDEVAIMTGNDIKTGSDRVWQAVKDLDCDLVVNIQGDEPLIEGAAIDALIDSFQPETDMATLAKDLPQEALNNQNVVKLVVNNKSEAIYFSRHPIPYSRIAAEQKIDGCLQHIGLYAYRKSFLKQFCDSQPCSIEKYEGLEQLRALYMGAKIKVVTVPNNFYGVDRPEDVSIIEEILKSRGVDG